MVDYMCMFMGLEPRFYSDIASSLIKLGSMAWQFFYESKILDIHILRYAC
jgi:hypothetical protein